ncbi:MAG: class I SAM-dependent methyltransferase [Omnitrophica WOR_2 bacterium]
MSSSGSYDIQSQHRDANSEIQRLAAQARLGWEKEARTLTWFGLKDGMSLLELGSGPGFITESLLALLPDSRITCLEIDPGLVKQAEKYLQDKAVNSVHFIEGSVMNTHLPDNRFDFAYARLLFQHLADPIGAAKEIWRVLKPGGRLVVYDIDDEIFGLTQPLIPEFPGILETFGKAQSARGGNLYIGRSLWRIFKAAGFTNLDLEIVAPHSDNLGIEPFLPQMDPDRLLPLVKIGLVSEQELEKLRISRDKFLASPEPYVLMLIWMVCGEKPRG